jgi:hypothetical protein
LANSPLNLDNLLDGFISALFVTDNIDHDLIITNRTKENKGDTGFEKMLVEHLSGKIEEPEFFRTNIRPVLTELFQGRCDIWLRHGLEKIKRTGKLDFKKTDRLPDTTIVDYLAVETGRLFGYKDPKTSCIFDHSIRFQPQAFISLSKAKKRGVKLLPVHHTRDAGKDETIDEGRDHLCMSDNLPWNDWIFLYNYPMIVAKCENPRKVICETKGLNYELALDILQVTDKIIQTVELLS